MEKEELKSKLTSLISKSTAQIILIVLLIFFGIVCKGKFFTVTNMVSILRQVTTMGIAALGISFLMITANLDFSVGAIYAFSGTFTAALFIKFGVSIYLAMTLSVLCCMLMSIFTGWIASTFKIPRMVTSMAMTTVIQGLNVLIAGNKTLYGLPDSIKWLGQGHIGVIPISTIIFLVLAIIVDFILKKTYLGRYMFAVGGNEEVARLSGINVEAVKYIASALCGFFAGLAGLVCMSRTFSGSPYAGGSIAMDVISAAVLGGVSIMGGTGKTSGLVTGVVIMGTLSVGLTMMKMHTNYQDIFKGMMLIIAVILDSKSKKALTKND
ncbi:MAG: ABC transporter permease [Erysipelotrichaceae bacterium]|jgi:ribose transport system permease protein